MESIEVKIIIDQKSLEMIAEVLDSVDELRELVPEWNNIEADIIEDDIKDKMSKILDCK